MVNVPDPVSVALPLIRISVTFPPEFSWIEPVLVIVPASVRPVLLLTRTAEELVSPLRVAASKPWGPAAADVPTPASDPPTHRKPAPPQTAHTLGPRPVPPRPLSTVA